MTHLSSSFPIGFFLGVQDKCFLLHIASNEVRVHRRKKKVHIEQKEARVIKKKKQMLYIQNEVNKKKEGEDINVKKKKRT